MIAEEGYSRDEIYNADETGLWCRMTPMYVLPELWWSTLCH